VCVPLSISADFGLVKTRETIDAQRPAGIVAGTHAYFAPELFQGLLNSTQADVYALGIMMWEILNIDGHRAWHGKHPDLISSIVRSSGATSRPSLLKIEDPALRDVIAHCWHADVHSRATCADALVKLQRIQSTIVL
jgi:serine/threonine protein kinase